MKNLSFSPRIMDVHFNKEVDRLKAELMRGKILELEKQIEFLKERIRLYHQELSELVGQNLSEQIEDPSAGEIIINYEYGYIYAFDQDLKLKCINEEIK